MMASVPLIFTTLNQLGALLIGPSARHSANEQAFASLSECDLRLSLLLLIY
jgi:hypothetical protein